jgi:hypothetical protein
MSMLIFYVLLFGVMYLDWCNFTKEQQVCTKFCANFRKRVIVTLGMIREAFREESISLTRVFERHTWFRAGRTSIEDYQHAGRPISPTTPDTVAKLQQLDCEDFCRSIQYSRFKVIKAESQAVLNSLTGHSFQDAFKKWQNCWECCTCTEGEYFEDDCGQYTQS